MTTGETMKIAGDGSVHFVVLWDFQLEDTDDVVRDGVVFASLKTAGDHAIQKFIQELDNDFGPHLETTLSRRLGKKGYIIGGVALRRVIANDVKAALNEALAGKGEDLDFGSR